MKLQKAKKRGFTLVELLVVIAILAILATVSVVGYTAFIKRARQSNCDTEAHQVEEALYAELISDKDGVFELGSVNSTAYYITNKVTTGKWVVATLSNSTYTAVSSVIDLTDLFKTLLDKDFEDLTTDGTFKTDTNGNIVYTVTYDGGTVSSTINFND